MRRKFILDIGNGNSHFNDIQIIKKSIDVVSELQDETDKIQFFLKTQIWSDKNTLVSKELKSTTWEIFDKAYEYAFHKDIGFTSSVFDEESRNRLICEYDVPFIKIACRPSLYDLILDDCVKYLVSVSNWNDYYRILECDHVPLICVPKYPATPTDYIIRIERMEDFDILDPGLIGLSDHTCDWGIYNKYPATWYECHFSIDRNMIIDPIGGNSFVREPKDIEEILK